ncbi:hypothetical protein, partial [Trueperella pyogenes]|uniref:hypothetical protein n=1 Tax=Trueperella pyogenes TaxID=1661 RepID=UPI00345DCA75
HTNEKYAQKQHKMANLKVESDRLKKYQTPPHQQKTRNQQHKMAYKPQKSGFDSHYDSHSHKNVHGWSGLD